MTESFGWGSTTDEVLAGIDLRGRQVLVTGVSAGLGVETARSLAAHGATVVGTARDLTKAKAATEGVVAEAKKNGGSFEIVELDLASLASVRAAAKDLAKRKPLDAVIANAGVMATPFGHTKDGFETQFGTNHLGHFLLVNLLASRLIPRGRVVVLSSAGHRFSDVDLSDPHFGRGDYDPWKSYGRSKTANVLFAVEFDRRHREIGVRATAVHPGPIKTELGRYVVGDADARVKEINAQLAAAGKPPLQFKSVAQGSATSVWAAVVARAEDVGGRYCEDCHVGEIVSDAASPVSAGVRPYALDPEQAKALWTKSEEMVGERF